VGQILLSAAFEFDYKSVCPIICAELQEAFWPTANDQRPTAGLKTGGYATAFAKL
jgi:hypothetical protein